MEIKQKLEQQNGLKKKNKQKTVTRDKKGHYIKIKKLIQEDFRIVNI